MEKMLTMDSKTMPLYIVHRINKIRQLNEVPHEYGVEIDIRSYGKQLLLNHDPIDSPENYDELFHYLKEFKHAFIIFNIKEAGIEQNIINMASQFGISDYFLLDVEFPFLYRATRKEGFRKIAVRYSEAEPVENVLAQWMDGKPLLDWVWIDTNTKLPLSQVIVKKWRGMKCCLVSPDRWGRPEDIIPYAQYLQDNDIFIDAIMTEMKYIPVWKEHYG